MDITDEDRYQLYLETHPGVSREHFAEHRARMQALDRADAACEALHDQVHALDRIAEMSGVRNVPAALAAVEAQRERVVELLHTLDPGD